MILKKIFINLMLGVLGLWLVLAYGLGLFLYPYVGLCIASTVMFWLIFEVETRSSLQTSPKGVWLIYDVFKSILWNIKENLKNAILCIVIYVIIGVKFVEFAISQLWKGMRNDVNVSFFGVILLIFSILTIGPLGIWWLYYQAPTYVSVLVACTMILWALSLVPFWSWLYKTLQIIVPTMALLFCLLLVLFYSLFKPKERNE